MGYDIYKSTERGDVILIPLCLGQRSEPWECCTWLVTAPAMLETFDWIIFKCESHLSRTTIN